ncbi:MAG: hypothetical protein ABFS09_00180 [Thermodesulfobacteriota bacterium]
MRVVPLVMLIFLLLLPGCIQSYRLSVEGGTTVDIFASQNRNSSYGLAGSDGMVSLAATDVGAVEGLDVGIGAVRWSGPYSDNTLVGTNVGYRLANDNGYFVRASIGPYYGDETVRTSTHWTFGFNAVIGMAFNEGKNEIYTGFWHFSNGSSLGLADKPNMSEEFLNCGISFLF